MHFAKGVLQMDVLLNPDVLKTLRITDVSLSDPEGKLKKSFIVFSFSEKYIYFLTNEKCINPEAFDLATIKTLDTIVSLPVLFLSIDKTSSKHWLLKFSYSIENLISPFKETLLSLFEIKKFQQKRRDLRVKITDLTIKQLHLKTSEAYFYFSQAKKRCLLHDLSFSGARFFSTESLGIDTDDKLILTIDFLSPIEIIPLRCMVVRKKEILVSGIQCYDIAVVFLGSVNLDYLQRLTYYFQNVEYNIA